MAEVHSHCRRAIAAMMRYLGDAGGEGVESRQKRLAEQDLGASAEVEAQPQVQEVCRYLDETLTFARDVCPEFAGAVRMIAGQLQWLQSASYTDARLGEGFIRNYAWAELIGPRGLLKGNDFILGMLLLGPYQHYPDHFHPAPELYWPLTPGSRWSKASGAFRQVPPGEIIWHPAMVMHATRTGDTPLLAPFIWTQDTATPARLAVP